MVGQWFLLLLKREQVHFLLDVRLIMCSLPKLDQSRHQQPRHREWGLHQSHMRRYHVRLSLAAQPGSQQPQLGLSRSSAPKPQRHPLPLYRRKLRLAHPPGCRHHQPPPRQALGPALAGGGDGRGGVGGELVGGEDPQQAGVDDGGLGGLFWFGLGGGGEKDEGERAQQGSAGRGGAREHSLGGPGQQAGHG